MPSPRTTSAGKNVVSTSAEAGPGEPRKSDCGDQRADDPGRPRDISIGSPPTSASTEKFHIDEGQKSGAAWVGGLPCTESQIEWEEEQHAAQGGVERKKGQQIRRAEICGSGNRLIGSIGADDAYRRNTSPIRRLHPEADLASNFD